MIWTSLDSWIVVAAALAGASAALVGAFLVLEKMSMMGDAISHAVLPGIAIAFILTGSRVGGSILVGATAFGVLTAMLVHVVRRYGRLDDGAAMGVVFTVLFALGLILIEQAARHVDIHPDHVLFGSVELVPLIVVEIGSMVIPRGVVVLSVVLLVDLVVVILFFKELRLVTFDPALATTLGISATGMHYLLMTLVALTTVAAFEVVGSILVIAMLVVPGAIAHLLTRRLAPFLLVSVGSAILAAVVGHLAAITIPPRFGFEDTNTAGAMATMLGLFFFTALLAAPERGLVTRVWSMLSSRMVVRTQDILGLLARASEHPDGDGLSASELRTVHRSPFTVRATGLRVGLILLRVRGLVRSEGGRFRLTDSGRSAAVRVLRVHRLWERFFHDVGKVGLVDLHPAADYLEHYTDAELRDELEKEFAGSDTDPRGNPLP